MRLWRRVFVPGIAALAVIFLSAAGASGVDQMANVKARSTTSVIASTAMADSQPSLRHLVMRGIAKGSLPGGSPYDEPREERYDENYQETLHQHPSARSPG